jgi:hypothetical protein
MVTLIIWKVKVNIPPYQLIIPPIVAVCSVLNRLYVVQPYLPGGLLEAEAMDCNPVDVVKIPWYALSDLIFDPNVEEEFVPAPDQIVDAVNDNPHYKQNLEQLLHQLYTLNLNKRKRE